MNLRISKRDSVTRFLKLFFMILTYLGSFIYTLKHFHTWFPIWRDIQMCKELCVVKDTAESNFAVSLTPQSQTSLCHWHHRGVKLGGISTVVSSTLLSQE